ncbi:sugar phosphate isomerase/epimerase family protein [Chthonobacter albigriseus]|uniref:sugar phosphate isomerase/epimerase family protein n=1 Tax=Chthonobacter albigriseus TaxID=1683161 RepID=UPI0015EF8CFD|nr:sugar phosphate isomerase/epimerase family protein [Chthonobacter albigriseus]
MPSRPDRIRVGMHTSLWASEWTREAAEIAIPEAAEHGLEVLEIALLNPAAVDAEHSRRLFEKHGVEPTASICLPFDVTAPLHPEKAVDFLMPALDKAHALGCSILCGVTYSTLGWKSGARPTDSEYANMAKALKPVARKARDYGMLIGIEPCNRYETHLLNTAAQSLAFLECLDEPNVTIHLDTYHMNIEEKGIGHGVRVAGEHCSYIHLSESDRGVPGSGTIDWTDVFRALAETGFKGDLVMESFVTLPPEIASALCVWRDVASGRQEVLEKGVPFLKSLAKVHGLA